MIIGSQAMYKDVDTNHKVECSVKCQNDNII